MAEPTLTLRLLDVHNQPLGERVDILLRHQMTGELRKVQKVAARQVNVTDLMTGVYAVQVDPPTYRAVDVFATAQEGHQSPTTLTFPVDPGKVLGIDASRDCAWRRGAQCWVPLHNHAGARALLAPFWPG